MKQLLFFPLLLIYFTSTAQVQLLKDINAGSSDSGADQFVMMNGIVYFAADDGVHGRELWRTDGSTSGTYMVKDINPGIGSSFLNELIVIGNTLYFAAFNDKYGGEVWKSDGTAQGTQIVKDINPGSGGINPINLTEFNSKLVFSTASNPDVKSIWISDGKDSNTYMINEFKTFEDDVDLFLNGFMTTDKYLYFTRSDKFLSVYGTFQTKDTLDIMRYSTNETELFIRNTISLSASYPLNTNNQSFFHYIHDGYIGHNFSVTKDNGQSDNILNKHGIFQDYIIEDEFYLLYIFYDPNDGGSYYGNTLYKYEDHILKNINELNFPLIKSDSYGKIGQEIILSGQDIDKLDNYPHNKLSDLGIWKFNPNTYSIKKIKDTFIYDGNENSLGGSTFEAPQYLTSYSNKVFFRAFNNDEGHELWVTDGTEQGTQLFADIISGETGSNPEHLISNGKTLFFIANDGEHGRELWKYEPNVIPTTASFEIFSPEDQIITITDWKNFPFFDSNIGDALREVKIEQSPAKGSLFSDVDNNQENNGETVVKGEIFKVEDLAKLKFLPEKDANDVAYSYMLFSVSDGKSFSEPDTLFFHITPVNDAPTFILNNETIMAKEDQGLVEIKDFYGDVKAGPETALDEIFDQKTFLQIKSLDITGNLSFEKAPELDTVNSTLLFEATKNTFGSAEYTLQLFDDGSNEGKNVNYSEEIKFSIEVSAVIDGTPQVTNTTTSVNQQSVNGLVIKPNVLDGEEVTHFKIIDILNGTLYLNDGTTQINNGNFISSKEAAKGLKFTPKKNSEEDGSFLVQASLNNEDEGLGGTIATAKITVTINPVIFDLSQLEQVYDGAEKTVLVNSEPTGIAYAITYNGETSAPIDAGSYEVIVASDNPEYVGNASATLTIKKATATVSISNIEQEYDGNSKEVTVNTEPAGLQVNVTYNGATSAPTVIGEYDVIAKVNEKNYEGEANALLSIYEKPDYEITITFPENSVYDGQPKILAVTTEPSDLNIEILYDGKTTPPVDAGEYDVVIKYTDNNGELVFEDKETLIVEKATAIFDIFGLQQTYDGNPKEATVISMPEIDYNLTYNGNESAPIEAGDYSVKIVSADSNYEGMEEEKMTIEKASAIVKLTNLEQVYSGKSIFVEVNTNPAGLTAEVLYNGSKEAPVVLGNYFVEASVIDRNYQGYTNDTLRIMEVTGITDPLLENQLLVYPNPTNGILTIEDNSPDKEQASVMIFDSKGKHVESHLISTKSYKINFKDMPSGSYFIYFLKNNTIAQKRIIRL